MAGGPTGRAILGVMLGLLIATRAMAQAAPAADSAGPNTSILRWAEGAYDYRTISDRRPRGTERFYLNVHPDGSRTMLMWHDLFARNAQFSVMLRVAADFRPLRAMASYWTAAGDKGSISMILDGRSLTAMTAGPAGTATQTLEVPEHLSFSTHPVAADGWHLWYADPAAKGPQQGTSFAIDTPADPAKMVSGALRALTLEVTGRETVTVPAGTFTADTYKIAESRLWILPQDRILVRMAVPARDLEYVLTRLQTGDNTAKEGIRP